ncbi:MAG: protein kinase [Myxococcota bacterium]
MKGALSQQRLVAQGTSASVHRAILTGVHGIGRAVALKRLRPELRGNRHAVEAFLAEARLAVQLRHPNVMHGLELGEDEEGYYLLCEWNDGASLAQVVNDSGPIGAAALVHIALAMCDALAYLHGFVDEAGVSRPIVHRDVTPANVLLGPRAQVRLADFGVACTPHIAPASRVATLGYVPPEKGESDPPLAGDDLYALATSLLAVANAMPLPVTEVLQDTVALEPNRRPQSATELRQWLMQAAARAAIVPSAQELDDRLASVQSRSLEGPLLDAALAQLLTPSTPPVNDPVRGHPHLEPRFLRRPRARLVGLTVTLLVVAAVAWLSRTHRPPTALNAPIPRPPIASTPVPAPTLAPTPVVAAPIRRAPPTPQTPVLLDLNTVPWSEVTIDGQPMGTTPLLRLRLAPGAHTVHLRNPPASLAREVIVTLPLESALRLIVDLRTGEHTLVARADHPLESR